MQRQVDFLITDRAMTLDVAGPMDVFYTANRFLAARDNPYRNRVISLDIAPLTFTGGMRVLPDVMMDDSPKGDTLVVAGGEDDEIERLANDERVQSFLHDASSRYRRIVSICNGALVLAHAGLLDGRVATTHWEDVECLKACSKNVRVCDDVLYVQDGNIYTSAGVTAGIDLALHLVEQDHGRAIALKTARQLVLYLHRPGDQRQFSELLGAQSLDQPLQKLGDWLQRNLAKNISLDDMAAAVNMSRRNFTRVFRERVGMTPGEYLERLRAETAGNLLAGTKLNLNQVAQRAGFGSEQTLRRVFARHFGVAPREYRARFGAGETRDA